MKQRLGARFHYDHSLFSKPLEFDCLKLYQIGELCLEPGFEVARHNQSCIEISYIISGKGSFHLDEETVAVSPGDIIITPISGVHAIQAGDQDALFYAYMGFTFPPDNQKFSSEIRRFFQSPNQIICQDRGQIYSHFRRCMDEFRHNADGSRLIMEACLTQIVIWAFRGFSVASGTLPDEPSIQNPGQLVYRIMRHIDRNIQKPLTVTGIADSLGYSPYYISHLFREKTGTTLQAYISRCKVEKAQELMSLDRFTLTEVAEKLSYPSLQSFSRAFRNTTGVSPSGWKTTVDSE